MFSKSFSIYLLSQSKRLYINICIVEYIGIKWNDFNNALTIECEQEFEWKLLICKRVMDRG